MELVSNEVTNADFFGLSIDGEPKEHENGDHSKKSFTTERKHTDTPLLRFGAFSDAEMPAGEALRQG